MLLATCGNKVDFFGRAAINSNSRVEWSGVMWGGVGGGSGTSATYQTLCPKYFIQKLYISFRLEFLIITHFLYVCQGAAESRS